MVLKGVMMLFMAVPLIACGCAKSEPKSVKDTSYEANVSQGAKTAVEDGDLNESYSENVGIKSFRYNESGMARTDFFRYEFTRVEQGVRFEYDFFLDFEEVVGEIILDSSVMDELEELSDTYGIAAKWNGFNGRAEGVLDGDSFGLYIDLEDGGYIGASGYHSFPEGYREFKNAFQELIDRIVEENSIREELFPKEIESEELAYISLCFYSKGSLGEEMYNLMITNESYDGGNTSEIYVKNDANKLFGAEEVSCYSNGKDYILKPFSEILKKHNIALWNGYDKALESSNEWFQIDIYYASGESINAYGSLLPEGYAEFKEDILNAFAAFYKENMTDFREYS